MGHLKALTMGAALALAPQFARAADMLPPAPVMDPPMLRGTVDPEFSGWYIRGDVGVSYNAMSVSSRFNGVGVTVPGASYDQSTVTSTGFVSLGVGYQFSNWFRADLTAMLRSSSAYHAVESYNQGFFFASTQGGVGGSGPTADRAYDNYNAQIRSSVFLLNGYFDIGTWNGLTPFVGAGVGFAVHNVSGLHDIGGVTPFQNWTSANTFTVGYGPGGFGWAAPKQSLAPAFALMTGLNWEVNKRLKLEIGYRYLNMGTANGGTIVCQPTTFCPFETPRFKLSSHEVNIGMRWMLDTWGVSSGYSASGGYAASGGYGSSGRYAASGYSAGGGASGAYGSGGASGGYVTAPVVQGQASAGGGYVSAGGGGQYMAAPAPARVSRGY